MLAKVAHIEYDPNRTARIALLHYADGEKRYILAPRGTQQGDRIESGAGADIKPGNNMALRNIPVGTTIHAIELRPGGGARSSPAPRVPPCSCSPRKAPWRTFACRPVRSAWSTSAAAPPSARSATPSSRTSTGARPAVSAGSDRPTRVVS
ncbi:hypothetical protein SALBM135S_09241 [Streptomyces alboniger]